jgi:hypothetical protein
VYNTDTPTVSIQINRNPTVNSYYRYAREASQTYGTLDNTMPPWGDNTQLFAGFETQPPHKAVSAVYTSDHSQLQADDTFDLDSVLGNDWLNGGMYLPDFNWNTHPYGASTFVWNELRMEAI